MHIMNWTNAGIALGSIIWLIGSATTLSDLMEHGKSLADYRKSYGKDLGMLVCCTYRGMMIAAWPVMGLGGFFVGLVRDTIKIVFGKTEPVETVSHIHE